MRIVRFAVPAAVLALGATGCASQYTGGGWYVGQNEPKANVGYGFKITDTSSFPPSGALSGTVRDGWLQARFSNPGLTLPDGDPCMDAFAGYVSTNPKYPGSGVSEIYACDAGATGPSKGDGVMISFHGGPYDGQATWGIIQGGNFTSK